MSVWCQQCTYTHGDVGATCKCCGAVYRPGEPAYEFVADTEVKFTATQMPTPTVNETAQKKLAGYDRDGHQLYVGDTVLIDYPRYPDWSGRAVVDASSFTNVTALTNVNIIPAQGPKKGYSGGVAPRLVEKIS